MRLVAARFHDGQDLKQSIEDLFLKEQLAAATIVSAVGSLSRVRMRMAGAQPDKQDIRGIEGPFEIVSLIGNLGEGRTHVHIAISDSQGAVIGGHLKEGSIVHTTVELVLAVDDSLRFSEENDPDTGFGELKIEKI